MFHKAYKAHPPFSQCLQAFVRLSASTRAPQATFSLRECENEALVL
ncbi:hypothetical protein SAMN04488030_2712 [Aliiroseovarius halocynthiae]|nr:hypothetical protein SAMN04488030_2712 [Aliiroseovarius halocynthiae]